MVKVFDSSQRLCIQQIFFYKILLLLVAFNTLHAQKKVIRLYEGKAPGSETWNWSEGETFAGHPMNAMVAYNVTEPTLVVYEPEKPNGVAVILCTGGAYHVLNIENEGTKVAKQLNKNGITVFLLKYRLVRSLTNDPWQEMMEARKDPEKLREKMAPLRTMAMTDLDRAIVLVRANAPKYKIDSNRIGIMGFSGGGLLAANVAYNFKPESRPDFVAPIYCVINNIEARIVKPDAPPLFIAAATDDAMAPVSNSVELYNDWMNANKSAELHLYSKGGHGLRTSPASSWTDRFVDWLHTEGFLKVKQ